MGELGIDNMSPGSGRMLGEDSQAINIADMIKALVDSGIKVLGSNPIVVSPVIASGASLSGVIDARGKRVARILIPASWTTANLTFQTSVDGTNFNDLYDDTGTELIVTATAGKVSAISSGSAIPLSDLMYLKIRSGTASTAVNQGGDRTLTVVLA